MIKLHWQIYFFLNKSFLKSPICPYKDQMINPPILIKGIKMLIVIFDVRVGIVIKLI